jgi:hypothetical protein
VCVPSDAAVEMPDMIDQSKGEESKRTVGRGICGAGRGAGTGKTRFRWGH